VSVHKCPRHPAAAAFHGHCPVCLFEAACALPQETQTATRGRLTIQVPLGEGEAASVFLVRDDSAAARLFRLKRWRTPAPVGFIEGFDLLKARLEAWRTPTIVLPVTAWLDETGCPSVVTDFRQGMPLLESVRSGWLRLEKAGLVLRQLRETLEAAHARGLAHGSVVAGNVFSARPDGAPYLLDFGLAVLLSGLSEASDGSAADLDGLARVQAQLERLTAESR
jgi:serine/threonine protein kinase